MKQRLKQLAPQRVRLMIRRASRLRWVTKYRALKQSGSGPWAGRPLRMARYVLWDPEVDTFTYPIANLDELAERLGALLDRPAEEITRQISEALADPELGPGLSRDIGWRVLFTKRRPPLPSHHLSAWAIIRVLKPAIVVETGILEGLGDRIMLRALELNRAEGHSGKLIAFDIMPGAGKQLVPSRLRSAWEPVYEPTPEAIERHVHGREVGLFLHDSVLEAGHLSAEIDAILPHMAPAGVLMTVHGWTGVMQEVADRSGGHCETFAERPSDHFYDGRTPAWVRLPESW